jgi:hypothetical protein
MSRSSSVHQRSTRVAPDGTASRAFITIIGDGLVR